MELEAFIRESLVLIISGVHGANTRVEIPEGELKPFILLRGGGDRDNFVEFDIAVTSEKARGGKAGISVAGLNAGFGGWGGSSEERVSRIRFRVTINKHLV
jgi:hypothetical protein